MIRNIFRRRKRRVDFLVEPDEIFLDSKNLPNFDQQQFEGRIEKSIAKKNIIFLGVAFLSIVFVFGTRLGYLQITKGETYFQRSENNILQPVIIFADRGIVYDRNKAELAWNDNDLSEGEEPVPRRQYRSPGFSHLLGYVGYPARDSSGNWWQSEFIGKDGLEKQYNYALRGENGAKIIEVDAFRTIHSENIVNTPERGKDLVTTIDSRIQAEIFKLIKGLSESGSFTGGAGVMLDARNGEVIALTNFPEYDSAILSLGKNISEIKKYIEDNGKFFSNRAVSGLYAPGSIVKPFIALGALKEGVIDPHKEILSTGSISIPNPYFPGQSSVFKDWEAHGWTAMREAIAVSSDVYFYQVGGGFERQRGIGILNIEKYSRLFGIGEKTGIDLAGEIEGTIPNPDWKARVFGGDPWRVGDTYNTAIGQYGFQATPLQMARAVSAIANGGNLVTPHLVLEDTIKKGEISRIELDIDDEYYSVVREGMREAVSYGTAIALNVPYVEVAAKTGTAQVGISKRRVNSWIIGYFPFENPKYAFAITMEAGPSGGGPSATSVMRQLLDWMSIYTSEYFSE
jgi:penicillin-binding protein 2